jgi:hypothetical protein
MAGVELQRAKASLANTSPSRTVSRHMSDGQASELAASSTKGPPSFGLAVAACNCGLIPSHPTFPRCPSIHLTSLRGNVEFDVMTLHPSTFLSRTPSESPIMSTHTETSTRPSNLTRNASSGHGTRQKKSWRLHYHRVSFSASATPSRA